MLAEYIYSQQLKTLEVLSSGSANQLPAAACVVQTPLKLEAWRRLLEDHPDRWFSAFILRGIEQGFRIGYHGEQETLRSRMTNMVSAAEHPLVVAQYLEGERRQKRVAVVGTPARAKELGVHCSPFGVIPKKNTPDKWRLILDLSSPEGHSVNDGVQKKLASLSYISVDDVIAEVLKKGRGSELAKMDVKQAYRNIPVHPKDRHLLGMFWAGEVLVDMVLPFGLRSAPLLFTAVADAIQWMMHRRGASWVDHYIDDFVTIGAPGTGECAENVLVMKEVFQETNLPIDPEKDEGPATQIGFLGMELDTEALEIRLPQTKLQQLKASLLAWRGRKVCRKRELLALIGSLSHACKAVRAGRSFLRRLIDLSTTVKPLHRFVRLGASARSDIEWWYRYCSEWNGIAMMSSVNKGQPEFEVSIISDASGSWGCGAMNGREWFQLKWAGMGAISEQNITVKELLPIVLAAALWGSEWAGKTVRAQCDNSAVVAIVNSGTSREREAMHLLRCLAFLEAQHSFYMFASHIQGVLNTETDALSRDNRSLFHSLHPQAYRDPVAIPESLLDVLIVSRPDWTSQSWTQLWSSLSVIA